LAGRSARRASPPSPPNDGLRLFGERRSREATRADRRMTIAGRRSWVELPCAARAAARESTLAIGRNGGLAVQWKGRLRLVRLPGATWLRRGCGIAERVPRTPSGPR